MEIILEKQSEVDALLKINISEPDYQQKLDKSIKEYSKKANINGFRPGKVPAGLIKQRFGKELKIEEVSRLVNESMDTYLQENNVKILARPLINREKADSINWNETVFDFEFEIGLSPEFSYKLDKEVFFEKYVVEITEVELDKVIEGYQKQFAESQEGEEIKADDFVKGMLKQTEGEMEEEVTLPVSQLKEEFQPNFLGKKKEEAIEIADVHIIFQKENGLKLWTGLSDEEVEKMTGSFTFTPTSIMHRESAELNNEFFDKVLGVGKVETEEEFRNQLKTELQESYTRSAESLFNAQVMRKLVEETEIRLPDTFLKKFIQENGDEKLSDEETDRAYNSYLKTLRQSLIESKIADEYEVKVEGEEVLERTKVMWREQFTRYGMATTGDDEFEKRLTALVMNYLFKENEGKNYRNMFERIFSEKVMEKAGTLVSVTEKHVSEVEFNKIYDEFVKTSRNEEESVENVEAESVEEDLI